MRPNRSKDVANELRSFASDQHAAKPKRSLISKLKAVPKVYLITAAVSVAALVGLVVFMLVRTQPDPVQPLAIAEPEPVEVVAEPEPELFASPLTGVMVEKAASERPVTGVMIENSLVARPQSGLLDAGVVFEAVAEGGITRFLALFQESAPDYIGPVRSARPYYVQWLAPFDASYVHVGGDIAGRAATNSLISKDLDQYNNSGAYTRVSNRSAPHNVYTDFTRLDQLNAGASSTFTSWPRKDDAPAATANASSVSMNISSNSFNPVYTYQASTNTYLRTHGGTPHTDERTGSQLNPKVVIAMRLDYSYYLAEDGYRTTYNTSGTGKAWVFQDGTVTEGTWRKNSSTDQIVFSDANGNQIGLNRGQTWISMVKAVTWQ